MIRHQLKILIGLTLLVGLLNGNVLSQSKYGTSAAQFLGISVGPRAIGMGGAYVASADDATSLYWNPGAFQQAGKTQFIFSNTNWLVDTKFRWFGFMTILGEENAVGVSITQLDYGEDAVTTVTQPDGDGERWSAQDLAFSASYCRRLTDRFSLGGSLKYIQEQIWNENAGTFAFDLGLLFVTGFNDMRLGVTMSNFGGDLQMQGRDLLNRADTDPADAGSNKALVAYLKTDPWSLPLLFRVGVAMDVIKNDMVRVTIAGDAIRPNDDEQSLNLGGEFAYQNLLFIRGGYNSIFNSQSEQGLSLGAGIRYSAEGFGVLNFDYAYTNFGLFGNINTIGLGISF